MKRAPILPTLALLLATASLGQTARGDAVMPALPEAYTPFVVEADWQSVNADGRLPYALVLDTAGEVVLIGYLNREAGNGPAHHKMNIQVQGLPPGTYSVNASSEPFVPGGDLDKVEYRFEFHVAEAPATQRVFAFYHTGISHYFITASKSEADGLLAQEGWEVVDSGFNVWGATNPAPETAAPVCRFYSSLVNSHFYTGDPQECAMLRNEDHGWTYEGIAFQALVPVDGACLPGTAPVRRMYNDRAAELDSNHRFSVSRETYRTMAPKGWLAEGIAFCSPPAAP